MILVTGATGLNGSAVIRACVDRQLPVRALVRDRAKVAALGIPRTVEVVEGDMAEPATLDGVLDGVERVLMISSADRRLVETQCTFKELLAAGIPVFFADAMDELFGERRKGSDESRTDLGTHQEFDVRPTTFAAFARRHADVFRGEAAATHLWASGWQSSAVAP
jgi:hypothetical protein